MVRNKHNFVVGEENNFPDSDIVPDQSISINQIIYNVTHGLPTGIAEPYQEFDDEDSDPFPGRFDDDFDQANYLIDNDVSEAVNSETKRDQTEAEQGAAPMGEEIAKNEDECNDSGVK